MRGDPKETGPPPIQPYTIPPKQNPVSAPVFVLLLAAAAGAGPKLYLLWICVHIEREVGLWPPQTWCCSVQVNRSRQTKFVFKNWTFIFFGRQRLTFWIKMASKKKTKIGRKCQCSNYLSLTSLITIFSNAMTLVYYIDLGSYNMK